MSTAEITSSHREERPSLGAGQLTALIVLTIVAFVAARFVDNAVPVIAAAGVAALVPRRYPWSVRAPIAVTAGLLALFLARMWPGTAAQAAEAAPPPAESAQLLSWVIGLPLAGSIAILFLPRQAHGTLRATTMGIMFATFAVALPILRVPMGRAYHFNQDIVWLPRFGIHYHVAIDGITLWLVMLTVFITPIAAWASFGPIEKRLKDWCFALLLLEGGMLGAFLVARPVPLLRLLGSDARPDVRHDRRLGRDQPHQERDQVLPLHDVRLGADARSHPLRRVRVRAAPTAA